VEEKEDEDERVVQVSCGSAHTVVLTEKGEVWVAGASESSFFSHSCPSFPLRSFFPLDIAFSPYSVFHRTPTDMYIDSQTTTANSD
jgi:hypothetical protein